MCTMLAGGLAGGAYALGQKNSKKEETHQVTNNYYSGEKEANFESEAPSNKDALKTQRPQGPSQSSRTNQAY